MAPPKLSLHLGTGLGKALSKDLFRKPKLAGRLLTLGAVALVVGMFAVFNTPYIAEGLNSLFGELIGPVLNVNAQVRASITDHLTTFGEKRHLQEENKRLKLALQKTQLNQTMLKQQLDTLVDLKDYLSVLEGFPQPIMTVNLLGALPTTAVEAAIIKIPTGKTVLKDTFALNAHGLMGRIVGVGTTHAKLQLLTHTRSRVPVKTLTSGHNAILTGQGADHLPTLEFVHASSTPAAALKDLEEGEEIVTSGEGGVFLANIPVGVLKRCDNAWCAQPLYRSERHRQAVMLFAPVSSSSPPSLKNQHLQTP